MQRLLRGVTACVFTLPLVFAQFDSAAILGTVRDQNGGAISGASITVKNKLTGITATTKTDEKGDYIFPTVKIGVYQRLELRELRPRRQHFRS